MFSLDKRLEKKMKCPQCGGIKFDIADDDSELAICLKCEYTNNPIDFCYDYILKLCNIEEMCKELVKNVIDYNDIDSIIEFRLADGATKGILKENFTKFLLINRHKNWTDKKEVDTNVSGNLSLSELFKD